MAFLTKSVSTLFETGCSPEQKQKESRSHQWPMFHALNAECVSCNYKVQLSSSFVEIVAVAEAVFFLVYIVTIF